MSSIYSITIKTKDGGTVDFPCADNETIIDAASKYSVHLPSACRSGNCGACHGVCSSGSCEHKAYSIGALSKQESERHGILMCRAMPCSDMTIAVDADLAHISAGEVPEPLCTISSIENVGGGVRRLILQVIADDAGSMQVDFEAGQYMQLNIPDTKINRAYSIANAPNWAGTLEFLIRLQPQGKFSTWLENKAQVGDQIKTIGPDGSFLLKSGGIAPRRFVAGGTGIAPMLSMLRQMVELQETHESHLYFGVTHQEELFCLDVIDELKALLPNLSVDVCVWKPESSTWQGFTGSPVDAFKRDLIIDLDKGIIPEVYLCGPPGLVDATKATAAACGLEEKNIFSEKFLPG
ncbi:MAG: FAD-binding oxidoreductase [Mariprofundales bacterium]